MKDIFVTLSRYNRWANARLYAELAKPLALCLAHFFNHQTHHRGQIHGLLGVCGIKAADIDLFGYTRESRE
ncbi:DinB family protein [Solidesulfovibrio sp. C21]|uniref:DinB family protein n=1 Tax=Solidesulfovibrio sp. C21 TaxID=3398613 RepID=UPI0039FD651D